MAKEIERKFSVDEKKFFSLMQKIDATKLYTEQGYISLDPVVRVRTQENKAYITAKGSTVGVTRLEYEYLIPVSDAIHMIDHLCDGRVIQKTRYVFPCLGFTWEVDVFQGSNKGLIVAEIELPSEDTEFTKPDWVLEELTDPKYFNSNLIINPYSTW